MGQRQSRVADDEPFESGVRVTQGLLEQLSGKPPALRRSAVGGGAATLQGQRALASSQAGLRPGGLEQLEAEAVARQDRQLARALERSRRVGMLLLRHEEEEAAAISQLADELLAREYAAPRHPRSCQPEAEACVRCYAEHSSGGGEGGDVLQCSAAVEAYSACAKASWREALRRGGGDGGGGNDAGSSSSSSSGSP